MMDASIKALYRNFLEWIAGPTGSVLIHVALLLALLFLVDFSSREREAEIEVTVVELDDQVLDELLEEFQPPEEMEDLVDVVTPPEVDIDMPPPPDIVDFTAAAPIDSIAELDIATDAISPIILKNLAPGNMANRSGEGRAASIRAYGGRWGEYAEVAVRRALAWLVANQNADGSWGQSDREAMTGLGILTFLAHGETPASTEYGRTVERAIRYLVARQNEHGEFTGTDTTGGTYAQAIAVYAISEAYGMTRIPSLKPVMEKGIQVILDGQQSKGGFDYRFAKGNRRDTSLGGWCCQAMKAAYIAGASNPGLAEAMERAVQDMKSVQREDGRFFYTDRGSHTTHSITAVAVLSLQLLGHGRAPEVRRGLAALNDADADWSRPPYWPMYAWYYITQAKFHQGGGPWSRWNSQFAPAFIRNQNPDGSWNSAGSSAYPNGTTGRENYHPVYSTTLAALSLQVYYRFLPTYQPIEDKAFDHKSKDDIQIQIL